MAAKRIVTPYEGTGERDWDPDAPVSAPLELHRTSVRPEWVDYNGHMSESCYLQVFGDNSDAFFRYLGIGERYREAGHSLFTVETQLHHLHEVSVDEPLRLLLRLLDHDRKRLHVFQEMRHGDTGVPLATAEQLLVHVDTAAGRSAAMPDHLLRRIDAVARSHADLETPDVVGRPIEIRRGGGSDGVRADG